ncbi:hypothetical protein HBI56_023000 [Parastagonospora nodorum]|uniref:Uncharacterized protein n=1 Tax=Phaeosphaeria nodorum (strain SN15 / ATCC MYA-4574 / FGSC 10173) TaxID=321614 RepID=A0A7U2I202_PHANO|nr:hypothetical protein HBH56_025510 [Parastagonospora nodorum]QRC98879.1 hypothetical protein JI435_412710 [Parastagonospora nodorum SN15]KAH3934340.1 hypothetical protein HBH54_056500 [Parastagonospora nodorum]KAH3949670.1 hypothetical protein HBH53_084190 [Parastagonospora nodorum]KAH3976028.1 hypothetical protein HBH51_081160 [Parastagonospora nodorum]
MASLLFYARALHSARGQFAVCMIIRCRAKNARFRRGVEARDAAGLEGWGYGLMLSSSRTIQCQGYNSLSQETRFWCHKEYACGYGVGPRGVGGELGG